MIYQHQNGVFVQNTWVYINEDISEAVIVDPGSDLDELFPIIGDNIVTHIFITHGHIDHIQGLEEAHRYYPQALIVAHKLSVETLPDPHKNLSALFGQPISAPVPNWTYSDASATLQAAGIQWKLLHTPGHAVDHTVFIGEDDTVFSGDLIFEFGSMGRVDFPGCDPNAMKNSIQTVTNLKSGNFYPGHGKQFDLNHVRTYF
ncbi:MAG: MBL fold metallo-hydrolase [Brevinemataceae bacterium]